MSCYGTEAKKLLKKLPVDFKIFHYSGPREVLRLWKTWVLDGSCVTIASKWWPEPVRFRGLRLWFIHLFFSLAGELIHCDSAIFLILAGHTSFTKGLLPVVTLLSLLVARWFFVAPVPRPIHQHTQNSSGGVSMGKPFKTTMIALNNAGKHWEKNKGQGKCRTKIVKKNIRKHNLFHIYTQKTYRRYHKQ